MNNEIVLPNSSDVFERLKIFFKVRTAKELASLIGLSEAAISAASKRNSIPYELCAKLAVSNNLNLDWLILGKGEMQPESSNAIQLDDSDAVFVPLYDIYVSAGGGYEVYDEEIIDYIAFSHRWLIDEGLYLKDLACLKNSGESMLPTLVPGDIILVNHAKKTGDGVFVIRMGNALRVKRLQHLVGGRLRISSDNPIYETEIIEPAELDNEFAILGECHTRISYIR